MKLGSPFKKGGDPLDDTCTTIVLTLDGDVHAVSNPEETYCEETINPRRIDSFKQEQPLEAITCRDCKRIITDDLEER